MKILCVSSGYYPAIELGGVVHTVHGLNKALSRLGHEVTVYASNKLLTGKIDTKKKYVFDTITCRYFKIIEIIENVVPHGFQVSIPLVFALSRNLKQFDIVHIHSTWTFPSIVTALLCRMYKKHFVFSTHGMLSPATMENNSIVKRLYFSMITKKEIRYASAIHFTTNHEKNNASGRIPVQKHQVIIPSGIDIEDYQAIPDDQFLLENYNVHNRTLILFLGRLCWIKGIDILINAFYRLYSVEKNVLLVLAGNDENNYSEQLKNQITQLGLTFCDLKNTKPDNATSILFTGMVEGETKVKLIKSSDYFILPSRHENFANVVLEAAVCKVPLILSEHVGVAEEFKKENAAEVVPLTEDALYTAIKKVADDSTYRNKLVENAYTCVVKKFTWDAVARQMETVYAECITTTGKKNA